MLDRLTRSILALAALTLAAALASHRVEAARDFTEPPPTAMEIVVMEVEGCKYCPSFRENVGTAYAATPRGREIPMRFVDVNAEGAGRLRLRAPIDTVPTAVLMRDHAEIGRIEGYVGPEDFTRLVSQLLSQR